jgi:hypothetical protein
MSAATSISVGQPAPSFELKALGSGRTMGTQVAEGTPLFLVFHDQNHVDAVQAMQQTLREQGIAAQQLWIASVVNMSAIPVFLRPLAENVMVGTYKKAAAVMPAGLDVADYVIILLDWDGKVSKTYGAKKISGAPLLVLVDGGGLVSGVYRGVQLDQAAQRMLSGLRIE